VFTREQFQKLEQEKAAKNAVKLEPEDEDSM
jgi:hypothetical protein